MTPDRNTLLKLIKEYGDSLLRIESEKDLQKAIAEQAEVECQVKPAQFKKAAMAYFKDKVKALRDELGEQMDLLDVIRGDASKTASDSILAVLRLKPSFALTYFPCSFIASSRFLFSSNPSATVF